MGEEEEGEEGGSVEDEVGEGGSSCLILCTGKISLILMV